MLSKLLRVGEGRMVKRLKKVADYVKEKKLNMLYAVDTKGESWKTWQTKTMPTNFLVCSFSIMGTGPISLPFINCATLETMSLGKPQTGFFVITSLHFFIGFSSGFVKQQSRCL